MIYLLGGGGGGGGPEDLGLNKVNLADPPYEFYFTEVIPPNNV